MKVHILAFGKMEELMGGKELEWIGTPNVKVLKEALLERFSGMKNIQFAIAVNNKIVELETNLKDGDCVALLPPFSGG